MRLIIPVVIIIGLTSQSRFTVMIRCLSAKGFSCKVGQSREHICWKSLISLAMAWSPLPNLPSCSVTAG